MDGLRKYINNTLAEYNDLPKRVREEIESYLDFVKANMVSSIRNCESPIEQLFHIHFVNMAEEIRVELSSISKNASVTYSPQSEIFINGKTYRLDFLLTCKLDDRTFNFAIECDGHNFHEKTKEQVARDKARERDLIANGFIVIRFSGSEIWKSPYKCAKEAFDIVDNKIGISRYWKNYINSLYGGDNDGETN